MTKRYFKVRNFQHMGVSTRTSKNFKFTKNSAVRDILVCNNIVSFE